MPYLNVVEVESALATAAAPPYSGFTQLIPLPHPTWEGRVANALRLGSGGGAGRPGLLLLGGVHAREWGSPDILVFFVQQLQAAYVASGGIALGGKSFTAAEVQSIIDGLRLYVFAQVNPDGRNYSLTSDGLWRKNRRMAPPGSACLGVDINRNYDFLWNFPVHFNPLSGVRNSTDPCSEVYIGPSATSEPETQNAVWMLDSFPDIRFLLDLHSFSESILYTWGDDDDQNTDPVMSFQNAAYDGLRGVAGDAAYREYIPSCDQLAVQALGTRMRDAIQAVRGTTYAVEPALSLYPTAGTGHDYAFSRQLVDAAKSKVYGYTIEWGLEFQPPYAEMQQIVNEITAGLIDYCLGVLQTDGDVYIKDSPTDAGSVPSSGVFWESPDIVVRQVDDDVFAYQPAQRGATNYVYVRVNNLGPADADNVRVNLRAVRYPGTEFLYPHDWTAVDADHMQPTPILDSWPLVGAGTSDIAKFSLSATQVETLYGWEGASYHPCLLAEVVGCNDYSTAAGSHVWENNNLAQRNISVIDAELDELIVFPFLAGSRLDRAHALELLIDRAELPEDFEVALERIRRFPAPGKRAQSAAGAKVEHPAAATSVGKQVVLAKPRQVLQLPSVPGEQLPLALRMHVPRTAESGRGYAIRIAQLRPKRRSVGGVTLEIHVRKGEEDA